MVRKQVHHWLQPPPTNRPGGAIRTRTVQSAACSQHLHPDVGNQGRHPCVHHPQPADGIPDSRSHHRTQPSVGGLPIRRPLDPRSRTMAPRTSSRRIVDATRLTLRQIAPHILSVLFNWHLVSTHGRWHRLVHYILILTLNILVH